MHWFLKIEAVNIYSSILDTDQLSVIRGSSYILKEAIGQIAKTSEEWPEISLVTEGGSVGVFSAESEEKAKEFLEEARNILSKAPYSLFTFVTNIAEAKDYLNAKEKLIALGRAQQVQNLRYPLPNFPDNATQACALNGFLPASVKFPGKGGDSKLMVSKSVADRYKYGRDIRHTLYRGEYEFLDDIRNDPINGPRDIEKDNKVIVKDFGSYDVTYDLVSLAGKHPNMAIDGKIALIYVDGNSFGKAQRKIVESGKDTKEQIELQQLYDIKLRKKRAEYLTELTDLLEENGAFYLEDDGIKSRKVLQLETLLWGGDEMTIVVPAWMGLRVLEHFFKCFSDFYLDLENSKFAATHSAGIVFCSAKTPIKRVNQLARSLAENIKELDGGREYNLFDYAVLESIDYPTDQSLERFWQKQFGKLASQRTPLAFGANKPQQSSPELAEAKEYLPRTSAYRLLKALIQEPVQQLSEIDEPEEKTEEPIASSNTNTNTNSENSKQEPQYLYRRMMSRLGKKVDELAPLEKLFNQYPPTDKQSELNALDRTTPSFWLHMIELYDYLATELPDLQTEGAA